jgi:heat shock protein HtpX
MYIINPLSGLRLDALFSTHPPTEERIRRLMAMGGGETAPRRLPETGAARPTARGPWG